MQVQAFLADAARVESGKLYVHGGAWDTVWMTVLPQPIYAMALVTITRLEWTEALGPQTIAVDLIDEENEVVWGPLRYPLAVGHPPGSLHGRSFTVPTQLTLNGLVNISKYGAYRFRIKLADQQNDLASVPMYVIRPPAMVATHPVPLVGPKEE
jgi:hypothetical protein